MSLVHQIIRQKMGFFQPTSVRRRHEHFDETFEGNGWTADLPPWLGGLAISGRGAVKAWLAIRQGVGSYPTPAGMSSQVLSLIHI